MDPLTRLTVGVNFGAAVGDGGGGSNVDDSSCSLATLKEGVGANLCNHN